LGKRIKIVRETIANVNERSQCKAPELNELLLIW